MIPPIRIKTFRAKTLQDAYQQIRTEFGPDASILETKATRFGMFGRTRMEVTASSISHDQNDANDIEVANERAGLPLQKDAEGSQPHTERWRIADAPIETANEDAATVGSVANATPVSGGAVHRDCVLIQLRKELLDAGIDDGIANQWIEVIRNSVDPAIAQDIWSLRSEVRRWIRDLVHAACPIPLDHSGENSGQQVIAFVGPSGAGKSTTLAKIAANLSMEQGISVGVLSTDTHRLGSNYLLQNYAEVLGWSFEVAESVDQVAACLKNLSACRIVLIDTRGCAPDDVDSLDILKQLLGAVSPTETHLVIPSTCNSRSFLRYERGFESLSPNRMILTRLDEAGGLGAFFPSLQCSSLPVSYLTNGQNIPADLIQATEMRLAQCIMP